MVLNSALIGRSFLCAHKYPPGLPGVYAGRYVGFVAGMTEAIRQRLVFTAAL